MLQYKINEFHQMFKLPAPDKPVPPDLIRLKLFREMLLDEISEAEDIEASVKRGADVTATVQLSDWLGDIIVYCASEMRRHGIPIEEVLMLIFNSNLSKLGADGEPIVENGKVQKGPNYWKPEPAIRLLLLEMKCK